MSGTEGRWIVVHTNPSEEFFAQMHLERSGYRVLAPWTCREVERGRKILKRITIEKRAYFSRYIFVFVGAGQSIYHVKKTPGVALVVCVAGRPLEVHTDVMARIMDMCASDGLIIDRTHPVQVAVRDRVGDIRMITEGPFTGFPGEIEAIDKAGIIRLSVNLFGRATPVTLTADQISAAA